MNRQMYNQMLSLFLNDCTMEIPDGLFFSALGARVCYSDAHPLDLLNDELVTKERKDYLYRCYRRGHFSVFAHSPVYITTHEEHGMLPLFKVWVVPHNKDGLMIMSGVANFWHLCDAGLGERMLMEAADDDMMMVRMLGFYSFDGEEVEERVPGVWGAMTRSPHGIIGFDWYVFIVHGVSRVCSHQLVRHQWLNFNQRSHRYTKARDGEFVIPVKGDDEAARVYRLSYQSSWHNYWALMNIFGEHRERARYVLPGGAATTVLMSGPRFTFEHFVEARSGKEVMEETRQVARLIGMLLKK